MRIRLVVGCMVLCLLAWVNVVQAGWFSKKGEAAPAGAQDAQTEDEPPMPGDTSKATRKLHMKIEDKKVEKELVQLFGAKRVITDEVRVLSRVAKERKNQYSDVQGVLLREFNIVPEGRYEYDNNQRVIYQVIDRNAHGDSSNTPPGQVSTNAAVPSGTNAIAVVRKEHLKMQSPEQGQRFVDLIGAKRRSLEQMLVVEGIIREYRTKLAKVDEVLSSKFNMKAGAYYDYDAKAMKLYEMVPPEKPVNKKKKRN